MTSSAGNSALGLVINSGPYSRRSPRAQLDVALAAAALEIPLHLYFLGDAVLQLLDERNPGAARLPPGYRGWASLPDLTEVRASAQAPWLDHIAVQGLELLLQVKSLSLPEMRSEWASCGQVLVL